MVCLAPRALEDSVRPRRPADVVARPLNFTVRRREKRVLTTVAWTLTSVVPYALLTVAGFLLWRRSHSAASAVAALGFAVALLTQLVGFLVELETASFVRAYQDDGTFVMVHAHTFPRIAHYVGLGGSWIGALGFVWYAAPSPNNRWRVP